MIKKLSFSCISALLFAFSATASAHAPQSIQATSVSENCPAFTASDLFRQPTKTTYANPSNWVWHVENAVAGEEVLLADGNYDLNKYTIQIWEPITIRSASGNRDAVILEGQGYKVYAEALMVMVDNVHISDITIRNVRDHAISIQEGIAGTTIYNVDLVDIGTQHIKGSKSSFNGVIACSRMGYTENGAQGDYNAAIDLHGAVEWTIRDNYIYNIYGDGSGCIVDDWCGIYEPGGEPAILIWSNSHDNQILRNTIVDSFRGMGIGHGTPYSGGAVKDNLICRSEPGRQGINGYMNGDAAISIHGAYNVDVSGNTITTAGPYPGEIEVRASYKINVANNYLHRPVWTRDFFEVNDCSANCEGALASNIVGRMPEQIICPASIYDNASEY